MATGQAVNLLVRLGGLVKCMSLAVSVSHCSADVCLFVIPWLRWLVMSVSCVIHINLLCWGIHWPVRRPTTMLYGSVFLWLMFHVWFKYIPMLITPLFWWILHLKITQVWISNKITWYNGVSFIQILWYSINKLYSHMCSICKCRNNYKPLLLSDISFFLWHMTRYHIFNILYITYSSYIIN